MTALAWAPLLNPTFVDAAEWALEAIRALGRESIRELHDLADNFEPPSLPEIRTTTSGNKVLIVYGQDWLEDLYYRFEIQAEDCTNDAIGKPGEKDISRIYPKLVGAERRKAVQWMRTCRVIAETLRNSASVGGRGLPELTEVAI